MQATGGPLIHLVVPAYRIGARGEGEALRGIARLERRRRAVEEKRRARFVRASGNLEAVLARLLEYDVALKVGLPLIVGPPAASSERWGEAVRGVADAVGRVVPIPPGVLLQGLPDRLAVDAAVHFRESVLLVARGEERALLRGAGGDSVEDGGNRQRVSVSVLGAIIEPVAIGVLARRAAGAGRAASTRAVTRRSAALAVRALGAHAAAIGVRLGAVLGRISAARLAGAAEAVARSAVASLGTPLVDTAGARASAAAVHVRLLPVSHRVRAARRLTDAARADAALAIRPGGARHAGRTRRAGATAAVRRRLLPILHAIGARGRLALAAGAHAADAVVARSAA